MTAGPPILALGPTNTGKTHRAIERMLEHRSGMIGLPLRLLAREVYDRISARIGEAQVALITGEEKRVPRAPRYWICTVEAMPIEQEVDFVAIDEIQLAAHRERGHVFTDRLLHARGRRETWLLGADTMAPLLGELTPGATVERRPRLSTLRWAGKSGLGGLPPRSAVIAFTADEVYALAARIRHRKGGAAVVLGALSPRTRNAQVALYEAGEVRHLVATDAIGMGLNLDIDHVAFASARKFDGKERRPLSAAELAQIAGRAGRHQRDGTFGTLSPLEPFPEPLFRRIEEHRFAPVERLVWRNTALDFASTDALLESLTARPPNARFSRVERADDFDALRHLAHRPAVRERATGEDAVRLLWEVCQIPDYRKLMLVRHVGLLETIFVALVDHGRLEPGWVEANLRRIDHADGDIDALTARLAAIRVWTYVSQRGSWVGGFGARTRDIEDRIGDALHERLVERFVERRRKTVELDPRALRGPFAQLGGILEAQQREEAHARERWVDALVDAPHEALALDEDGVVHFRDAPVGRLIAGRELTLPEVAPTLPADVGGGAQHRIARRMAAFGKDCVRELLAPIELEQAEGPVALLLERLERGLGTIRERDARADVSALTADERRTLARAGIVLGTRTVYARALLTPAAIARRALLTRTFLRIELHPPPGGAVTLPRLREVPSAAYLAIGFVPLGTRAVRADIVERVVDRLSALTSPFALPREVGRWLGVRAGELPRVLAPLGYRPHAQGWQRRAQPESA